jgi:glucan biosynthesis protein C
MTPTFNKVGKMAPNTADPTAATRYHDIDWLRVFATLLVFLFHAAKPFLNDPWHIKNAEVDPVLEIVVGLVDLWMMPLLFVVSGMSIALSLRSRTAGAFVQERAKRLLTPFLFGLFILSPLQVYVERLNYKQFNESFLQFLPQAFSGFHLGYGGEGNFAWTGLHLWFLGVLLIYSLLLLPLFVSLLSRTWQEHLTRLGARLENPGLLFLTAVPLMLLSTLNPAGLGWRQLGAWNFPIYLGLLLYGFLIIRVLNGYAQLYRYRWLSLLIALAAGLVAAPLDGAAFGTVEFFIGQAARGLAMWAFILLLLGLFYPLRWANSRFLRYTSGMVLPFYILNQPIIIILGYFFVLPLNFPPLVKYVLLVVTSLPIVAVIYEFLVRRSNPLRILHGLKPLSPIAGSAVGAGSMASMPPET